MPRRAAAAAASAASPEVTTTIRMPNAPAAVEPQEKEKPFFWERLAAIPIEKFEKEIEVWIYRLEPKVRMAPGERGYLDIVTQPISPSYIKKRWGGGRYRIMVLENSKILYSCEEEIEGDPIYDKRREVAPDGAANGNAAAAVGADFQREFISVLREELQRSRESNQGATAGTDQVVQMLTSASEKAMEIVTRQSPPKDAGSELNNLLDAAKKIAEMRAPAAGGASALDKLIEAVLPKLIEKFMAPVDPIAELTKLGALFDVLEKLRGGAAGAGEPKDWKAALVAYMPQILDVFKQGNETNAAAAQARAAEAAARARAAENLRNVTPAAIPAAVPPAVRVPAATPPPAQPISVSGLNVVSRDATAGAALDSSARERAPVELSQEEFDHMLKINIVNLFRAGASGGSIASFIEDLKPEFAKDFTRYTAQQITLFFSQDPVLKLIVEDPRWNEVLEDARDFMKDENADLVPAAV